MRQHGDKVTWPNGYQSKTFRFGPELLREFYALAEAYRLTPSALACFFLRYGIDQVKAGALKIPIKPMGAVIADGRAYE